MNSVNMYCLTSVSVSSTAIQRLQYCQNFGVRAIFRLPRFSRVSAFRKKLEWLDVTDLADYRMAIMTHKAIMVKKPSYLSFDIRSALPQHHYNTRHFVLHRPLTTNQYGGYTFHARSVELYNKFGGIIYAESLPAFKQKVKRILLNSRLDIP